MKLSKVRVTHFRSIEDSGEFEVGQLLCLVGKNEAGKTALEQALAGLNPHPSEPVIYDLERDYPRRWLAEYAERHEGEGASVIITKWTLDDDERAAIAEIVGATAITDQPVKISRRYGDAEPQWELPLNFKIGVENLIAMEKLDQEEKTPLASAGNSQH